MINLVCGYLECKNNKIGVCESTKPVRLLKLVYRECDEYGDSSDDKMVCSEFAYSEKTARRKRNGSDEDCL